MAAELLKRVKPLYITLVRFQVYNFDVLILIRPSTGKNVVDFSGKFHVPNDYRPHTHTNRYRRRKFSRKVEISRCAQHILLLF